MNVEKFNEIFEEQVQRSRETLGFKAKEYATTDRLHNFKVAAEYLGMSPEQACLAFATKHFVSIADMCHNVTHGETYDLSVWNEKIGDAINYLFLLRAIVQERIDGEGTDCMTTIVGGGRRHRL